MNGIAGCFLIAGWFAIKSKRQKLHTRLMIGALTASTIFMGSYLYYHFNVGVVTKYQGVGIDRIIYFTILFTHIPLATLILPFVFKAVWHAAHGDFEKHTKITRWLWPTWLYVSVTGVLIYVMLY